jgi:hypothetical protein
MGKQMSVGSNSPGLTNDSHLYESSLIGQKASLDILAQESSKERK